MQALEEMFAEEGVCTRYETFVLGVFVDEIFPNYQTYGGPMLVLGAVGYRGYVSVEMANTDLDTVRRTLDYVAEVFA